MFVFLKFFKNEWFAHSLFLMSDVSKSLRSLTKNERCEQIAQVTYQQWGNEQIARFFEQIGIRSFFCKKQAQKTDEQISNPKHWVVFDFAEWCHNKHWLSLIAC